MENIENNDEIVTAIKERKDKITAKYSAVEKAFKIFKDKYAVPFVHNNMALKGNKFNLETVKLIVKEGFVIEGIDYFEGNDILAINDCYNKTFEIAMKPELTEEDIKSLHKLLNGRDKTANNSGEYQSRRLKSITSKMVKFVEWFNSSDMEDTEYVASAYQQFIYIHPFRGGNGIMARLIGNIACLKRRLTPFIIPLDMQERYEDIIKRCERGVTADFLQLVRECILDSENYIKMSYKETYSDSKNRHVRGLNLTEEIYELIKDRPGIKSMEIKTTIARISFVKVQNSLKELREKDLIEFRGSQRSGGYFAKEEGQPSETGTEAPTDGEAPTDTVAGTPEEN